MDMKKFFKKCIIFFVLLFLLDMLVGRGLLFLATKAKGGDTARQNNIIKTSQDSILIFGSSRAIYHYNAQMISDSLNMECLNCGYPGMGIIFNFAQFELIKKRYKPSMVIYDVMPEYDLYIDDHHKYLSWLKPYYTDEILNVFDSVDKKEKFKMLSQLYRCNSLFYHFLLDYFYPVKSQEVKGFRPLKGEMVDVKIQNNTKDEKTIKYDSLKLSYLEKLAAESKDYTLVFVVSPMWYGLDPIEVKPIIDICSRYNLRFINYSNDPKFIHKNNLFKDVGHLNNHGANEFTRDLIKQIK